MSATSSVSLPLDGEPRTASDLVARLRSGDARAHAELYDRYAPDVSRVLVAVMGPDAEIADLLQETFVEAFGAVARLRDAAALGPFLRQIAVFRARTCIRKRRRARWFASFFGRAEEREARVASPEHREALAETYRILGELSNELRVPFALRHIEGLDLADVADACDVSLATVKRRLTVAEARFFALARHGRKLDEWLSRRTS